MVDPLFKINGKKVLGEIYKLSLNKTYFVVPFTFVEVCVNSYKYIFGNLIEMKNIQDVPKQCMHTLNNY